MEDVYTNCKNYAEIATQMWLYERAILFVIHQATTKEAVYGVVEVQPQLDSVRVSGGTIYARLV